MILLMVKKETRERILLLEAVYSRYHMYLVSRVLPRRCVPSRNSAAIIRARYKSQSVTRGAETLVIVVRDCTSCTVNKTPQCDETGIYFYVTSTRPGYDRLVVLFITPLPLSTGAGPLLTPFHCQHTTYKQ